MLKLKTRRIAQVATLSLGSALLFCGGAVAQVFTSDVIIQGSLCVGLDCVSGESFGFDTIRLKENNTRINFQDTSVGTFPSTDWEIRANDSASGGANYLGIVDRDTGRVISRFEGAAPSDALVVESDGDVGVGTLNPALRMHLVKGDSPGLRLEQNGSSGFTPQTWDLAGNETNFFVRDVTNGSQLPFRIFPSSGDKTVNIRNARLGVGTDNPQTNLHVSAGTGTVSLRLTGGGGNFDLSADNGQNRLRIFDNGGVARLTINPAGNIGIGTIGPTAQLHTTGTVRFEGVSGCGAGIQSDGTGVLSCLASTRRVKNIAGMLEPQVALANVMALRPHTGAYKATPEVPEHWLLAEDVAAVEPALVGFKDGAPYVVKTYGVVADLVAVIQLQQQELDMQRQRIEALEAAATAKQ